MIKYLRTPQNGIARAFGVRIDDNTNHFVVGVMPVMESHVDRQDARLVGAVPSENACRTFV